MANANKVDREIELSSWVLASLLLLIFVPKNRIREAHIVFLFKQLLTWIFGLLVVEKDLLRYPKRLFFPIVAAGVTFVPLRSLAALLNAEVQYNGTENSVTVTKASQSMKILIKENMYQLESTEKFPLTIKTVQNRTLLPLRFIAEYLQLELTYYGAGPIARLIDKNIAIQYTDEQLYSMYKDKIENEKQQWKAVHEEKESSQIAYLTFDDGPNANTAVILDILKNYNAHATFFMIEPKIRNNKEAVLRMVAEKHTIEFLE